MTETIVLEFEMDFACSFLLSVWAVYACRQEFVCIFINVESRPHVVHGFKCQHFQFILALVHRFID